MNRISYIFCCFAMALCVVFTANYAEYRLPLGLIPTALSEIKALDQEKYSSRELTDVITPLLQRTTREQDKEMMREIAKDFFQEKVNKRVKFAEIEEMLKAEELESFIKNWKHKMYMKLLELYKIDYDEAFLREMLNDPDFYGLTYDAYQMMTFEVEVPKTENAGKVEPNEGMEDKGVPVESADETREEL